MSFLNPIMLAGLAAVSVPIIIHLLNRRKFRKVTWAAMRFLQNAIEQNQRRMRIEDMILLALRCLLLALLALALARPAIFSDASAVFGQSKVTGVVVLDNSMSMGVSDGTATRFEKARRAAEQVIDSLPSGSATAVLLASDVVQPVIPEPTYDLNLARKAVREAALTDRATDVFAAVNKALDTLRERIALRKEVYLVTDGQATGWRQLTEIQRALERTKSDIKTTVVLVNEHEERNLAVSDLRLGSGLSAVGQPLRFEVKVTNHGKEEVRNARVSLGVNAETASDEFTIDALPAGATKSVTLFGKLREAGFHSVTARLPEDRLTADDRRTMAVRAMKEVNVLLVDGEPGSDARDSEVFFLKNALVPVPADAAQDYFIKTTTVVPSELAQARFEDFDAVVLANVVDFGESVVTNLEGYVKRGGGLLVFPGSRTNPAFYNEQWFKQRTFLPAEFGNLRGDAGSDESFVTLQDKGYTHSIVELWNDPGAGRLAGARFFRRFELKQGQGGSVGARERGSERSSAPASTLPQSPTPSLPAEVGVSQIVLSYADGTPAVMERPYGLGRVIQFSSTADTAWNDLPVRLAFVPMMHRALGSIVQRQDEGLNIRVGEKFVRRVAAENLDQDATFFAPRQSAIRELRRVELVNAWPTMQFERTDAAGIYDVKVGESGAALKFAAQPDPAESSLEELSPAQLATLKGSANVVPWTPNLSLRGMMERGRSGVEFWMPVLLAVLVLAAAETFLGQWFSRSK